MLTSVSVEDPEWSEDDIASALEWQYEQALLCSGCGHPRDESMDDETKTGWIAEPVICWACAASERRQRQDNKDDKRSAPGTRYLTHNRAKDAT